MLAPYGLELYKASQIPGEKYDAQAFCDRQQRPAFFVVRSLGQ
jgi:hypothetical protein